MNKKPSLSIPSPFALAVILTFLAFLLAYFLTLPSGLTPGIYFFDLLNYWETGFWELLAFSMQMSLILLLGHTLAISKPMVWFIDQISAQCTNTSKSATIISLTSILLCYINWGLGLVFGAILVRKVGEYALKNGIKLNYPLLGAAGYVGMMVWHGGFSGSAPLTVAQQGHFLENEIGLVAIEATIFSEMNVFAAASIFVLVPVAFAFMAKRSSPKVFPVTFQLHETHPQEKNGGMDTWRWPARTIGFMILLLCLCKPFDPEFYGSFSFVNLNYINFFLFGACLILHGNISNFLNAVNQGIGDISGIVIQFPLYAGIMGIMKYSGLIIILSEYFESVSSSFSFPLFAFLSAGIVNTFVPSGGGQWAVQGPILVEAAKNLNVDIGKTVMAMAYGDQLTNMLQPFWALPLLGITKLKASEILPYTFRIMGLGTIIFTLALILF